jgi:Putative lumazine-binding
MSHGCGRLSVRRVELDQFHWSRSRSVAERRRICEADRGPSVGSQSDDRRRLDQRCGSMMCIAFAEVYIVLQDYFDALYFCDVEKLAHVFHPKAIYATADEPQFLHRTMKEYFSAVAAPIAGFSQRDPSRSHRHCGCCRRQYGHGARTLFNRIAQLRRFLDACARRRALADYCQSFPDHRAITRVKRRWCSLRS